jgi:hypothetical protein
MRPGQLEVGAKLHQLLPLSLAQRWRLGRDNGSDLAFYLVHGLQCLVPAALQFAGHQAIGGIDSIVLPTGIRGLEARLLKRQLKLPSRGRCLARLGLDRSDVSLAASLRPERQSRRSIRHSRSASLIPLLVATAVSAMTQN